MLVEVHEKIKSLKKQNLTPAIAMKIASSVQCAPYLPATMKNAITVAAQAYESASDKYSSALQTFSSDHKAFTRSLEEDKNTEEPPKALEEYNTNSLTKDIFLIT